MTDSVQHVEWSSYAYDVGYVTNNHDSDLSGGSPSLKQPEIIKEEYGH